MEGSVVIIVDSRHNDDIFHYGDSSLIVYKSALQNSNRIAMQVTGEPSDIIVFSQNEDDNLN